eukprot:m.150062 g.150062  ORF g.150062 m.150062 type:complete len:190 (+) comp16167_c7_seq1:37-606(+)
MFIMFIIEGNSHQSSACTCLLWYFHILGFWPSAHTSQLCALFLRFQCLGDAVHKGNQRYEYANHVHIPQEPKIAAAGAVLDTAIWQGLASVALPGLVINRVVATTRFFSLKSSLPPRVATLLPTIAGLSAIPFIIKPIDKLVDRFMDSYVRPHIHLTVEHLSSDGEGQDSQGSSNVHNNTSQEQQQRSS